MYETGITGRGAAGRAVRARRPTGARPACPAARLAAFPSILLAVLALAALASCEDGISPDLSRDVSTFSLTVQAGEHGMVTPTGVFPLLKGGAPARLSAQAEVGYFFTGWEVSPEGSATLSPGKYAETVDLAILGDSRVKATFGSFAFALDGTWAPGGAAMGSGFDSALKVGSTLFVNGYEQEYLFDPLNQTYYWGRSATSRIRAFDISSPLALETNNPPSAYRDVGDRPEGLASDGTTLWLGGVAKLQWTAVAGFPGGALSSLGDISYGIDWVADAGRLMDRGTASRIRSRAPAGYALEDPASGGWQLSGLDGNGILGWWDLGAGRPLVALGLSGAWPTYEPRLGSFDKAVKVQTMTAGPDAVVPSFNAYETIRKDQFSRDQAGSRLVLALPSGSEWYLAYSDSGAGPVESLGRLFVGGTDHGVRVNAVHWAPEGLGRTDVVLAAGKRDGVARFWAFDFSDPDNPAFKLGYDLEGYEEVFWVGLGGGTGPSRNQYYAVVKRPGQTSKLEVVALSLRF